MIESIELTCGPTPKADPIKWTESPGVTIFVGPNNSGKKCAFAGDIGEFSKRTAKQSFCLEDTGNQRVQSGNVR